MTKPLPHVLVSGVCLGQPPGGVRRHNAELLPRLAERLERGGGSLTVLEGRVPITFPLPPSVERIQTRVHWLPTHLRAAAEPGALARAIQDAHRAGRPFDLVHTAHLPTPRSLQLPFTLTIHDLRSLDLDRAPFVRRLIGGKVLARATDDAARIFVVSEWMRTRVCETFPSAAEKVRVIGNGLDHLPLKERSPTKAPFLLHVGHLEPRKNLDLLVRALATDPHLPPLVLAGLAKGSTLEDLRRLAMSLGVEGRVRHEEAPTDERIAELYAAASCAAFPSRLEGHGLGPLEAYRAGCPAAASDIPAHLESLARLPEGSISLFAVDDPAACARAINAAMQGNSARRPTPAAFRAFRALPTWDACADAWVAGLEEAHGSES
ncbi:MAG: glycosyltransferase family 1 protein [Planctomycetota bacterium]